MQAFLSSWFDCVAGDEGSAAADTQRWNELLQLLSDGQLEHWQSSPPGTLALILLYTQVPLLLGLPTLERNHFKARALCISGIRRGFDTQLDLVGRHSFYAPLFQSNIAADRQLLGRLLMGMRALAADPDPQLCRLDDWQRWWQQANAGICMSHTQ